MNSKGTSTGQTLIIYIGKKHEKKCIYVFYVYWIKHLCTLINSNSTPIWNTNETAKKKKKKKVCLKPLTVWIMTNCGKLLERWEYQTILPVSWETCMWVKKQQLELDMKQQTGSKLSKKYYKDVYCHPAYLTYIQSTSCKNAVINESQTWIKIARRNINNLRYAEDTTLMAESEEDVKSLLMRV